MLPHSYELPAAILLVLGGALSCFAGYRLFKIVLAILGAIGAMLLQRYVIIVATAFGGAWTMIVGALALMGGGRATARGAPSGDVWILYPTTAPGQRWAPIAWIVLGLVGTAVQLGATGKKK